MNGCPSWKCRDQVLNLGGAPLVMGILNVTPDSFSDGGEHGTIDAAVAHGLRMLDEGADIIDVGGESTRPGADAVSEADERARVVPVIEELARQTDPVLSVDTSKAAVARDAVAAGAVIVNDVTALAGDPDMPALAARAGVGVVLMHMRGTPRTMQSDPVYADVVSEVREYLKARVQAAVAAGVARECVAVDPGIGFGKTAAHNVALLARVAELSEDAPLVVGLSRKSFLGHLTGRDVGDRLAAGLAALACCVMRGAHVMRVHDVKASRDASRVAAVLSGRAPMEE